MVQARIDRVRIMPKVAMHSPRSSRSRPRSRPMVPIALAAMSLAWIAPASSAAQSDAEPMQVAIVDLPATADVAPFVPSLRKSVYEAVDEAEGLSAIEREGVDSSKIEFGRVTNEKDFERRMQLAACRIGKVLGVREVLILDGYDAGGRDVGRGRWIREIRYWLAGEAPPEGSLDPLTPMHGKVWLGVRIRAATSESCRVRAETEVRINYEAQGVATGVMAGAKAAFHADLAAAMRRMFTTVVTRIAEVEEFKAGAVGVVAQGQEQGILPGHYFRVLREQREVGQVRVVAAKPTRAHVAMVRGQTQLRPGDRLLPRKPLQVPELGLALLPQSLARNNAADSWGVGLAVNGARYQPTTGGMYHVAAEYLRLTDFTRVRAEVGYGYQYEWLPRRLFAYGRLGVGVHFASQDFRPEGEMRLDGVNNRGLDVSGAIGVKGLWGDRWVGHVYATMPVDIRSGWFLDQSSGSQVQSEELSYPDVYRRYPLVGLGVGWRFL